MVDVFVYDHVRTPRGRGKKDGSLHEVPSVRLASYCLNWMLEEVSTSINTAAAGGNASLMAIG